MLNIEILFVKLDAVGDWKQAGNWGEDHISCTADTRTTSKPFPHASWGRLDMQPNKNIKKPKQGEKESKQGTRKLRFWHMGCWFQMLCKKWSALQHWQISLLCITINLRCVGIWLSQLLYWNQKKEPNRQNCSVVYWVPVEPNNPKALNILFTWDVLSSSILQCCIRSKGRSLHLGETASNLMRAQRLSNGATDCELLWCCYFWCLKLVLLSGCNLSEDVRLELVLPSWSDLGGLGWYQFSSLWSGLLYFESEPVLTVAAGCCPIGANILLMLSSDMT